MAAAKLNLTQDHLQLLESVPPNLAQRADTCSAARTSIRGSTTSSTEPIMAFSAT